MTERNKPWVVSWIRGFGMIHSREFEVCAQAVEFANELYFGKAQSITATKKETGEVYRPEMNVPMREEADELNSDINPEEGLSDEKLYERRVKKLAAICKTAVIDAEKHGRMITREEL